MVQNEEEKAAWRLFTVNWFPAGVLGVALLAIAVSRWIGERLIEGATQSTAVSAAPEGAMPAE